MLSPSRLLEQLRAQAGEDEVPPPTKRLLTVEDCTWRGDTALLGSPGYDPKADPRWGRVHLPQWEAVRAILAQIGKRDEQRQFFLLAARQSAKTSTEMLAAVGCATEIPKSRTLYTSFDLATGAELIYEPAQQKLEEMGWRFKATSHGVHGHRIVVENGSLIQIRSADDLRAAGRLRGRGWHLVMGDELQEMLEILQRLFDDVLGATTFRYSGVTVGAFTPPDVQVGWLWDQFRSGRWQVLGWPMAENPFLPDGAAERWRENRGLTVDHPTYLREVLGRWVPNPEKQVYEFRYEANTYNPGPVGPEDFAELPVGPEFPADKWVYGVGGDIGWVHPSSTTLGAWNRNDPQKRIYEVLTLMGPGWTTDHWFEVLMKFRLQIQRRPFESTVLDQAGSGGLNVVHTLEARFQDMGLPIELTYKPNNVPASVGVCNDAFRLHRLKLRTDSPLLTEIPQTVWLDGSNRQEIDKAKFDPHGLDGLRYLVWGLTNYRAKAAPPQPDAHQARLKLLAQRFKARGPWG